MHFANFVVETWRFCPYNLAMPYTTEQQKEFADFCARNDIRFGNLTEARAAIEKYFDED